MEEFRESGGFRDHRFTEDYVTVGGQAGFDCIEYGLCGLPVRQKIAADYVLEEDSLCNAFVQVLKRLEAVGVKNRLRCTYAVQ